MMKLPFAKGQPICLSLNVSAMVCIHTLVTRIQSKVISLNPYNNISISTQTYCFNLFKLQDNFSHKHDDVIKWKHFQRNWPFVQGIHCSPVNSQHKRPVTGSFDVFFDLRLNKRLSKQSWGRWFETISCPLWRHHNECHFNSLRLSDAIQQCRTWSSLGTAVIGHLSSNKPSPKPMQTIYELKP